MTDLRRYDDDEVCEIFALASRGERSGTPALPSRDGLTLAEVEEVGREAGLDPTLVVRAARAVRARSEVQPRGSTLGVPTAVGRTIELAAEPTERQWSLLAAEMAQTFGGVGTVTGQGGLRRWSNDHVHAFLEPTDTGYRLRLTSTNASGVAAFGVGGIGLALGAFFAIVITAADKPLGALAFPGALALGGVLALLWNVVTAPRWADQLEAQMEQIAERAREVVTAPSENA
jgi:hypothetical protein